MKLAVIPARGGSKRIPRKNLKLFDGVPMIVRSIRTALESGLFDQVVVPLRSVLPFPLHEVAMRIEPRSLLDLTAVVLGPLATQILGDYGADVIKVEPPEGDLMRANGVSRVRGLSSIFLAINRNKRSLAIDLRSPAARPLLEALVREADVIVENYRTGGAESLGVGYEAMAAINPRLVYCALKGFLPGPSGSMDSLGCTGYKTGIFCTW